MRLRNFIHLLTSLLLAISLAFLACSKTEQEPQTQESTYTEEAGTKLKGGA